MADVTYRQLSNGLVQITPVSERIIDDLCSRGFSLEEMAADWMPPEVAAVVLEGLSALGYTAAPYPANLN